MVWCDVSLCVSPPHVLTSAVFHLAVSQYLRPTLHAQGAHLVHAHVAHVHALSTDLNATALEVLLVEHEHLEQGNRGQAEANTHTHTHTHINITSPRDSRVSEGDKE